MKTLILASAAMLGLAACGGGGDAPEAEVEAEPVDVMLPGNFMVRTEVTDIQSVDDADPLTDLEVGQVVEANVCIGEDGILPASAFAEGADACTIENPYQRRGRLRQNLVCERDAGQVNLVVEAEFDGETISGTISSGSAFAGEGDYQLTRSLTAERTGDCTAAEAAEDLEAEVVE